MAATFKCSGKWTIGTNGVQMEGHYDNHLYRHKLAVKRYKWARKS